MAVSYNNLWKLLIDKGLNKTELKEKARLSTNAVAKLGRNEKVSMETIEKMCLALNCNVGDIVDVIEKED